MSNLHVITNTSGGWSVRKDRALRALRAFDFKEEAIEYAETLAEKDDLDLYIHNKDGSVDEKRNR